MTVFSGQDHDDGLRYLKGLQEDPLSPSANNPKCKEIQRRSLKFLKETIETIIDEFGNNRSSC